LPNECILFLAGELQFITILKPPALWHKAQGTGSVDPQFLGQLHEPWKLSDVGAQRHEIELTCDTRKDAVAKGFHENIITTFCLRNMVMDRGGRPLQAEDHFKIRYMRPTLNHWGRQGTKLRRQAGYTAGEDLQIEL
jgi:hypothetical protein